MNLATAYIITALAWALLVISAVALTTALIHALITLARRITRR